METTARIEEVFREESGRIMATLIRLSGSFDLAEEAMQEAFVQAASAWPRAGVPHQPAAWITTAARRKLIDAVRRERTRREKNPALAYETALSEDPSADIADCHSEMPDERLRLIFTCCHPALNPDAQIALTLRTLGGLTTGEIARSFLVPEATLAQRLVRAKAKIRVAGIPYEVPAPERMGERLAAVQAVLYLIFNEGYAATSGAGLIRRDLVLEAIRLARVLCELMPLDSENRGLLALMLLQDSRRAARVGPDGELITLENQNRSLWNHPEIAEALRLLASHAASGRYHIEARIAATHARAVTPGQTDWWAIARLYQELSCFVPSPVVALNHAVAVAMADKCEAGLALMDRITALNDYYLYHSARADLLRRLGRNGQAAAAYRTALALVTNDVERAYLRQRLASVEP